MSETMNISLPGPMKTWVESQKNNGRYNTASDYIRDLIRHDQERASKIAAMQKLVDEAFESGDTEMSLREIWEEAKAEANSSHGN